MEKTETLAKVLASNWQVFANCLGRSRFSYFLLSAASSDIRHLPALDRRGTAAGDAQLHLALCGLKLEEACGSESPAGSSGRQRTTSTPWRAPVEDRPGRAPLRSRAAAALRRHRADRRPPHRRAGRARPRGDAVRQRRGADQGHAGAGARPGHPARPAPLKSDLAAHLSMLHELHQRRDEFDVLHFHVDLIHFPFFAEHRGADRDHAARPARPEGPAGGLSRAGRDYPAGLDLRRPARARCPRPTGSPPSRTGCRRASTRFTAAPRRRLPRLPRPHLAGEAARPGDRDRQARGPAAEDRGQGRRRRPRLLRAR